MDEGEGCEICESCPSLSPAIWEEDAIEPSEREILSYLHHFKTHQFTPEQKKYILLGMRLSELLRHPDLSIRQAVRKIIAGWYGEMATQETIQIDRTQRAIQADEIQSIITTLEEVIQLTPAQDPVDTADSAEGN